VEIDGETVIYDVDLDSTHLLNPTATVVWCSLDGETTVDQLSEDLALAFRAPRTQVRTDILTLLRDLGRAGLLEGVDPETIEPETMQEGRP
jgi:hypothetical protein